MVLRRTPRLPLVALLFGSATVAFTVFGPGPARAALGLGLVVSVFGGAAIISSGRSASETRSTEVLGAVLLLLGLVMVPAVLGGQRRALERREARFGVPLDRVERLAGTVRADAHPGIDGEVRVPLAINAAGASGLGVQSIDASGTVVLTLRAERAFYQGLAVQAWPAGEGFRDSSGSVWFRVSEARLQRDGFRARGWELRAAILAGAAESMQELGRDAGSLFAALVLGLRGDLAPAEIERFRRAGAMHVLALSGMHLGILAALCVAIVKPLLGRNPAIAIAALGAGVYVILVGLRPSLLRALLMYLPASIAMLRGRRLDLLTVLSLSFIGVLVIDPGSLETLSFQLSFAALSGIALLSGPIALRLQRWVPPQAAPPLAAAAAAQLATAPFLAVSFGVLHPVGLISSLVLVPLVTAFLWVGIFAWAVLHGIAALGARGVVMDTALVDITVVVLRSAVERLYRAINAAAEFFAAAPPLEVGESQIGWVLGALTGVLVLRYYLGIRVELRRIDLKRRLSA